MTTRSAPSEICGFHQVTGPVFSASAGKHVLMVDNIADQWINGDDMNLNFASADICREP